jgi:hypothetical protein
MVSDSSGQSNAQARGSFMVAVPTAIAPMFGNVNIPATAVAGSMLKGRAAVIVTDEESGFRGPITVNITNNGNIPASGIDIMLSASADGATAGIPLKNIQSSVKIQPGKSKTFKLHFMATSFLAAGNYFPYLSVTLGGITATDVGGTQFTVG